jgi:hypothetical protein
MKTIRKFGLYELKWRLYSQPHIYISPLSTPNTQIGGAYFLVPAHGINTVDSLSHPPPNGGWDRLLSLVVAHLKAEK